MPKFTFGQCPPANSYLCGCGMRGSSCSSLAVNLHPLLPHITLHQSLAFPSVTVVILSYYCLIIVMVIVNNLNMLYPINAPAT